MSDKEDTGRIAEYLAEHPRMMGVLLMIVVFLTQVGTVVAGDGTQVSGP